eukprot:346427_1
MAVHWVVALGPLNEQGLYEWSVVSLPDMSMLWITTRNMATFNEMFRDEVFATVEALGFTDCHNTPMEVYQGTDCLYGKAGEDPDDEGEGGET